VQTDKKKSELYFGGTVKKILTEKCQKICGATRQNRPVCNVDGALAVAHDFFPGPSGAVAPPPVNMKFPAIEPTAPMRSWVFRLLLVSLFAMGSAVSSVRAAADELLPPFGFRWNDPMPRVEAVLKGAKARIVAREKKENREVWTVEGLVHPGLKRTLFTFKQGSLFGVELQYEYPDRTIEWYNQRMGEIRRYFDAKFGTGKLVSRSRDSDSDVIQTLVGYQWMVGATMLELFYFSAQHDDLVFRTISVDYKAL
jgi:hypothetical protein